MSIEIILIGGGITTFVAIIYFVERWSKKNDPTYKRGESGSFFSFIGGDSGGSGDSGGGSGGGDGGGAG